jgi:cytochrome c2
MKQLMALSVFLAATLGAPLLAGAQSAPDAAHGESLFEDICMSCHIKTGGGQGPTLVGVVGRAAASAPGAVYTKALQEAHLTWTPENLDSFLASPNAMVPGTAMPMSVPDPKDRADVVAYLASPANKP